MLNHPPIKETIYLPQASEQEQTAVRELLRGLSELPRFSHHPACKYWSNHLIYIGGHPLCLGCTCVALGVLVGLSLFFSVVDARFTQGLLFLIGLIVFIPTVIQIWYQRYEFKIASRFLLGVSLVLTVGASVFERPWDRNGALVNVALLSAASVLVVSTRQLRAKHLDVPCQRCPEGRFPFCTWKMPLLQELAKQYKSGSIPLPESVGGFLIAIEKQIRMNAAGDVQVRPSFVEFVSPRLPDAGD